MKKPKLRELREAITSLFSRPYTSRFPYVPHIPQKRFRGNPKFDQAKCIGCTACAQVCPGSAIEVLDSVTGKTGVRKLTHLPDRCIFCGQCEANCPTKEGIQLSREFDLSFFQPGEVARSVEHPLLVCESCGEVIGTLPHLYWIARRIGNLAYSQGILISKIQEALAIPSDYEEKANEPLQRQDMLKAICPRCRRIAFLADEKSEAKRPPPAPKK